MSDTPNLDRVLKTIDELGVHSEEWHEAMGFLLLTLARKHWDVSRSMRRSREKREKRSARARAH